MIRNRLPRQELRRVMGSDGSAFNEVSALLRAARSSISRIPTAFDLDALLTVALSEAERLHKRGMLERPRQFDGVQVILSSDHDGDSSVSEDAEQPKP